MGGFINFNIRGDQFTISEKSIESAAKTQQKETSSVKSLIKGIASKVLHRTSSTGIKDGNLNQPQHAGLVQLKSKLEHLQQAIKDHTESIKEIQSQPGTPLTYLLNSQKSNLESLKKEWQETKTGLEKLNSLEQKYNFPHATLMTEINGIAKTIDDLAQPILNHGAAVAKPEVAPKEAAPQKNEGLNRLKNIFRRSSDPTSSAPRPVTAKTIESDIKAILKSKKPIEEKRAALSQKLTELKKLSLLDSKIDSESIKAEFGDQISELFADNPLHVGFALSFPEEAKKAIQEKYGKALNEEKDLGKGLVPVYDRTSFYTTKGNFVDAFFEGVGRFLSQDVEEDSRKRCGFKILDESIQNGSASDLKSFFSELANLCEDISISCVAAKIMTPELAAGISSDKIGTFKQDVKENQNVAQTSAWDETAAQVKMGGKFEAGRVTTLETSTGEEVTVTSLKKDFGVKTDEYSGDGARSFALANGVSAHVVVDAAGNSKQSFEATARVIDMVSRRLEQRSHDLSIADPEDVQKFLKETLAEGMRICGQVQECTFSFNLIFPGTDGRRLLVGVSAGDTFVFTRTPGENGRSETKILTSNLAKGVEYSGGALGYNLMSAPRIFDVLCQELAPDEELYIASDAVRDNFQFAEEGLKNGEDAVKSTMTPIFERMQQQKDLVKLKENIESDMKSIESRTQRGEQQSEEYKALMDQHTQLAPVVAAKKPLNPKNEIHKQLLCKFLNKAEVTDDDFKLFNEIFTIKPDDYSLIEVKTKRSENY